MKMSKAYYVATIADMVGYDEEKWETPDKFMSIIEESVNETFKYYDDNFDGEIDDFEVFENDLLKDAKIALGIED